MADTNLLRQGEGRRTLFAVAQIDDLDAGPRAHRFKDVADRFLIEKTAIELGENVAGPKPAAGRSRSDGVADLTTIVVKGCAKTRSPHHTCDRILSPLAAN